LSPALSGGGAVANRLLTINSNIDRIEANLLREKQGTEAGLRQRRTTPVWKEPEIGLRAVPRLLDYLMPQGASGWFEDVTLGQTEVTKPLARLDRVVILVKPSSGYFLLNLYGSVSVPHLPRSSSSDASSDTFEDVTYSASHSINFV